jgi:hypothetical protein
MSRVRIWYTSYSLVYLFLGFLTNKVELMFLPCLFLGCYKDKIRCCGCILKSFIKYGVQLAERVDFGVYMFEFEC